MGAQQVSPLWFKTFWLLLIGGHAVYLPTLFQVCAMHNPVGLTQCSAMVAALTQAGNGYVSKKSTVPLCPRG